MTSLTRNGLSKMYGKLAAHYEKQIRDEKNLLASYFEEGEDVPSELRQMSYDAIELLGFKRVQARAWESAVMKDAPE